MEYGNMLSCEDKNFGQNLQESKRLSARRLIKLYPNKNWKEKDWTIFCKDCAQPVQSSALLEVLGHGHPNLQIPMPQLRMQF